MLWWNFYEEYEKRQQLSQTFNQTLSENNDNLSESFNKTSDKFNQTFFQANETFDEMVSKSLSVTTKFQIPLLFVSVNAENMFLTLSIIASLITV